MLEVNVTETTEKLIDGRWRNQMIPQRSGQTESDDNKRKKAHHNLYGCSVTKQYKLQVDPQNEKNRQPQDQAPRPMQRMRPNDPLHPGPVRLIPKRIYQKQGKESHDGK